MSRRFAPIVVGDVFSFAPLSQADRTMFDKFGSFLGDKIGAVQGKMRSDRFRIVWPGRRRRAIRRARRRAAATGAKVGRITGWASAGFRWLCGLFF